MTIALLPALGTPLLTVLSGGLPVPSGGFDPLSAPMLPLARPVPAVFGRTADVVNMHPDPNALPGGQVLQNLMNGLDSWALALALIGLVIGAAAWALGSHGQNYQQSFVGRRAVLISGLAALLIGAGPGLVSFFFTTGSGVH
ncbi:MAG TPA: DUF6112 family protein [Acidimicrobiales bacterium]|jgi:hypothetical protein|nr:DUF6112 family protein [Acidimicrobiales bacterium]